MEERNIVYITAELLRSSIGLAEIILFLSKIMCMRLSRNKIKWIASCMGITVANALFILLVPTDLVKGFFDIIFGMILVLICVEGKTWNKIIKYFFAYFGLGIFYEMVKGIVQIIPAVKKIMWNNNNYISLTVTIIFSFIIIVAILLCAMFANKYDKYQIWVKSASGYYWVIACFGCVAVSAINGVFDIKEINELSKPLFMIVQLSRGMMIVSLIALLSALAVVENQRQHYKREVLLKDEYLKLLKEHYSNIEWQIKNISRVKHDMNAHYLALEVFISENDWNSAKNYLEKIRKHQLDSYYDSVKTGNKLVDAIITYLLSKYNDIELKVDGSLANVSIDDYDLCTIFSNLIQNAIESTAKVVNQERKINMKIKHYLDNLLVEISNPIEEKIDIGKLGFFTTKENENNMHGFGISNVRETINANSGVIEFYYDEKSFFAKIMMKNKKR